MLVFVLEVGTEYSKVGRLVQQWESLRVLC